MSISGGRAPEVQGCLERRGAPAGPCSTLMPGGARLGRFRLAEAGFQESMKGDNRGEEEGDASLRRGAGLDIHTDTHTHTYIHTYIKQTDTHLQRQTILHTHKKVYNVSNSDAYCTQTHTYTLYFIISKHLTEGLVFHHVGYLDPHYNPQPWHETNHCIRCDAGKNTLLMLITMYFDCTI